MRRRELVRSLVGQSIARAAIGRVLRWAPMHEVQDGYSVVLGTPWDLRHLLTVNLTFIERLDLEGMRELVIVFDRGHREDMERVIAEVRSRHGGLPLRFMWYPPRLAGIIERINVSTFYNAANVTSAIATLTTRHAVMHDFDLYPLSRDYFKVIWNAMNSRGLRFSGLELTPFYGLTEDDAIIGTWSLGVDVEYLRGSWRPVDCFHRVARVRGRWVKLDPFSWVQMRTPDRALAGDIAGRACHVKNLCSTYLRLVSGGPIAVVWRLHYLWYLEYLAGDESKLDQAIGLMRGSANREIMIHGRRIDFAQVDPGAASFLRAELEAMEVALHGMVRPEVGEYLDSFERFLVSR